MENIGTEEFYYVGNNLTLDFINSAVAEINAGSLAVWAAGAGLISEERIMDLSAASNGDEVGNVIRFREQLREMVEKLTARGDIADSDIDSVNKVLRQGGRFVELQRRADGFAKRLDIKITTAKYLLVPVAESFADLLCYGNLDYLRKCERAGCIIYFYDTTKNHRRRWCSMAICGNRAKASRYYQKKKEAIMA